jgi:hypothetical protein
LECSGKGWNTVEQNRRVRNVLLEYMTTHRGIPQQSHLEMGGRAEKLRGYALHKQRDNQWKSDTCMNKEKMR